MPGLFVNGVYAADMTPQQLNDILKDNALLPTCIITDAEGEEHSFSMEEAGFRVLATHAVEGFIWFTPNLNENWERPEIREKLLEILHLTEKDRELMGMSPHFLTMAVKPVKLEREEA